MKDKLLFFSSVLVAFIVGSLVTYLLMTKQQMDNIMQAKQQQPVSTNNQNEVNQTNNPLAALEDLVDQSNSKSSSTALNTDSSFP